MQIENIHRWKGREELPKVICLHGFLGNGADFEILADHFPDHPSLIAPDFPDYTQAPASDYSWKSFLQTLDDFIATEMEGKRCVLLGYSMGGRITLQYATQYSDRLAGLVLIGATPGISDEKERINRAKQDFARASSVLEQPLEKFLDVWFKQDLIQSQKHIPEPYKSRMRNTRKTNSRRALARALISLGSGSMSPVWDQLTNFHLPTLLVTGEKDPKFVGIAEKMMQSLPNARHVSIRDAGHACCFETPEAFTRTIASFCSSSID